MTFCVSLYEATSFYNWSPVIGISIWGCWRWLNQSVQWLSHIRLCNTTDCSTPGLPVHHQLPEFTQTQTIESVMPSSHLILGCPLLFPPSIFPSIRVFFNDKEDSWDFSGPMSKNPPCNAGDTSSISGPARSHMPRGNYWTWALEPGNCNYWSLELMLCNKESLCTSSPHITAKNSPHSPQLEKALCSQPGRPSTDRKKQVSIF